MAQSKYANLSTSTDAVGAHDLVGVLWKLLDVESSSASLPEPLPRWGNIRALRCGRSTWDEMSSIIGRVGWKLGAAPGVARRRDVVGVARWPFSVLILTRVRGRQILRSWTPLYGVLGFALASSEWHHTCNSG